MTHETTPPTQHHGVHTLEWTNEEVDGESNMGSLLNLYREGKTDEFDIALDDLVFNSFAEDRLFMGNVKRMHDPTISEDIKKGIRDAQRRLFQDRKNAILAEMGIVSEDEEAKITQARQRIRDLFKQSHATGHESEDEVLATLGMLESDEEGNERFVYPEGLFPEGTDAKWAAYLGSVKYHLQTARAFGSGLAVKEEVEHADKVRRLAHNAISRDLHEFLGLEELPGSTWDFEKTRRLVMKMREKRFPNQETAEKMVTTGAVARGLAAVAALAQKIDS